MDLLTMLSEMFEKGGFFMIPITLCAVFGAAISLERFFYLYLRAGVDAGTFMAKVQRMVLERNVEGALRLCNGEPSASLPRVMKAGLVRVGRPDGELRASIEEACLEVQPLLSRRLAYLPMLANVATLLGLLGTIQGLIASFHAVSGTEAGERSTALASGIAVAMYTTFYGLLVAIPILVLHSLLAARANQVLDDIDHYAAKLANLLGSVRRGDAPAAEQE